MVQTEIQAGHINEIQSSLEPLFVQRRLYNSSASASPILSTTIPSKYIGCVKTLKDTASIHIADFETMLEVG